MAENQLLERLAENLRALRRQRGVTRDELAAQAQVDAQTIKRIEHGRANPPLVVLSRLTAALAISLSLILGTSVAADVELDAVVAESEAFDSDTVGETLTAMRKSRRLSKRALAAEAGLRTLTLSRYESATTDARLLSVEPLARALGVDTPEFVRTIEMRQQAARSRSGWHTVATGVRRRRIANAGQSRLWEWRIAPGVAYESERTIDVAEEIVTAIRGEVRLHVGGVVQRLHRGGSATVPDSVRRLVNSGTSTARVLWYEVTK